MSPMCSAQWFDTFAATVPGAIVELELGRIAGPLAALSGWNAAARPSAESLRDQVVCRRPARA